MAEHREGKRRGEILNAFRGDSANYQKKSRGGSTPGKVLIQTREGIGVKYTLKTSCLVAAKQQGNRPRPGGRGGFVESKAGISKSRGNSLLLKRGRISGSVP